MNRGSNATMVASLLVGFLLAGCAKIDTDYGASKGKGGRESLNGFGALRASYEQAGFRSRDVSRLSERVMRTDAIVWTPQVLGSVDPDVTRWFERWLQRGNHTLVYVVPDSGSEADYWMDTSRSAPPGMRLEYRKRAARSVNERMTWRLNRTQVQSNGWFRIEALKHRKEIGEISGPWKQDLPETSDHEADISAEFLVVAFDPDKNQTAAKPAANARFLSTGPTGPGNTPQWTFPTETKPTKTPIGYSELIRTESGDPIVVEIRSKNWRNSRIIVVAGGSLLTNYAFSRSFNRQLASRIITQSTPPGDQDLRAGFLTSNWNKIPISETKPGAPMASGMELLTVWPMSLVTMHGVMLGLVICLMLLPIFGRPGKIQRSRHSNFGDHLDAVAALMNKAGGERYARARISEYMKRMHGETTGPWILPDLPTHQAATQLTSKRLTSPPLTSSPSDAENETSSADTAGDPTVERGPLGTNKSENDEAEH
jgi:hypothetical protein